MSRSLNPWILADKDYVGRSGTLPSTEPAASDATAGASDSGSVARPQFGVKTKVKTFTPALPPTHTSLVRRSGSVVSESREGAEPPAVPAPPGA